MAAIQTSCAYCGVGCGIAIKSASLTGDPLHPANQGRLCAKGESLLDSQRFPQRLLYPQRKTSEGKQTIDWQQATELIAEHFSQALAEHGAESVGLYLSGQLLTEDYYVANKLGKGFWQTANVDTNSRLCMSSAVVAHQRAFGEDAMPGCYQDLELADVVVLIGSNAAWTHPVLFQRLLKAREKRGIKLVVIDPRNTDTAKQADLHLAIQPDTDLLLLNQLLIDLAQTSVADFAYIQQHTQGFEETLAQAKQYLTEPETVLAEIGITKLQYQQLLSFYQAEKVVTASCQGVNQSVIGADTASGIIHLHLLRGDIGRAGCGALSLTGQPNAMGGREVGGMASQLACHLDFSASSRALLADFWQVPRESLPTKAGRTAVELFQAAAEGKIKALWIMGTNPLASLPDTELIKQALQTCPFVVVSDMTANTDTAQYADLLLPAQPWGEKSGMVTNSERCLSRQRAFSQPLGQAKADWQALCDVAIKMGYQAAFAYQSEVEIFREHAQLSAMVCQHFPEKQFNLSGLAEISDAEYQQFKPQQWPILRDNTSKNLSNPTGFSAGLLNEGQRLFADGQFATANGKARFTPAQANGLSIASTLPIAGSVQTKQIAMQAAKVQLLTGRSRDQWHTMTRTGHVSQLRAVDPVPQLELNRQTAEQMGWETGQYIYQHALNKGAPLIYRLLISDELQANQAYVPMHWTQQVTGQESVNRCIEAKIDPFSKQPAYKSQWVELTEIEQAIYGVAFGELTTHQGLRQAQLAIKHPLDNAECLLFVATENPIPFHLSSLHQATEATATQQSLSWQINIDNHQFIVDGIIAHRPQGRVLQGLCVRSESPLQLELATGQAFIGQVINPLLLQQLEQWLAQTASDLVCICHRVSREQIEDYCQQHQGEQVDQLYQQLKQTLKCGTGCGSCEGQVQGLVAACRPQQTVAV